MCMYVSVSRVQEEGEAALKIYLHLHPEIRFRDLVQTYRSRKPDCQHESFLFICSQ